MPMPIKSIKSQNKWDRPKPAVGAGGRGTGNGGYKSAALVLGDFGPLKSRQFGYCMLAHVVACVQGILTYLLGLEARQWYDPLRALPSNSNSRLVVRKVTSPAWRGNIRDGPPESVGGRKAGLGAGGF